MNKVELVDKGKEFFTDEGRLYIDGLFLKWTCPNCGKTQVKKLDRDSYFYDCIDANAVKRFSVGCGDCFEEFQFMAEFKMDFVLTDPILRPYN